MAIAFPFLSGGKLWAQTNSERIVPISECSWVVKLSPLSALVGEFPISAEYALGNRYTVEAGIGILTRNYIASTTGEAPLLGGGAGGCEFCDYNANISWFVRARLFLTGMPYSGGYIGATVHRKPFDGSISVNSLMAPFAESATDLGFFFGLQSTHSEWFLLDIYFGAAVRMVNFDRPFFDFSGSEPIVLRETLSETGLVLSFGVQVGVLL